MRIDPELISLLDKWLPSATSAASGLVGVLIGAGLTSWLASGRERRQRQHAFRERQIDEFYSPMLGIREEVKALSELRVKIQAEAGAAWQALAAAVAPGPEAQELTRVRFPQFEALIEYDNRRLTEGLLPAYRKMVELFRDKLWLAEEETRKFYPVLLEFLDVWDRWVDKSLPVEVLERLEHGEEKLQPFYAHLQQEHDRLRAAIAAGVA